MGIEYIEDIDRKIKERERKKIKKDVAEDITEVAENVIYGIEDIFKRREIEKQKKENRKRNIIWKIIGLAWMSGLILLVINFVLVNIWLVKFFIKSLFVLR